MIKAGDGLQWILQGLQLLRKRPAELMSLSLMWMALFFLCALLGEPGVFVWQIATPALCFTMLQACRNIDDGVRQDWRNLLQAWQTPLRRQFIMLGLLWLCGALLSTLVLQWQLGPDLLKSMANPATQNQLPAGIDQSRLLQASLFSLLLLWPFVMALWFTPGLVGWRRMAVPQALFYSLVSVWRALGAFMLYGLGLFLSLILFSVAMQAPLLLVKALLGNVGVSMILLASCNLMFALGFASMYCCYRQFFGMSAQSPSAPE